MALLTIAWISEITFVYGFDCVTRFASPKRSRAVSATRAGIKKICLHIVFCGLAREAELGDRLLKEGLSTKTGLSVRLSKVSSPTTIGTGMVTSSDAASTFEM